MEQAPLRSELPAPLSSLQDLARDLRWTWSHGADAVWRHLDPRLWEHSENPWMLLQDLSRERLEAAAADPALLREVQALDEERRRHLADPGWFGRTHPGEALRGVAYFCMEFGLGEALPLYAGGLGVLAGDFLKAASDLGVPVVGVGLLYQEGYFRQMLGPDGRQVEVYPYNDPFSLPVEPVAAPSGGWLHIPLDLPGRQLLLRVWKAEVGRVPLYLLDSNDPLNSPVDRGITGKLYGAGEELRLLQQAVLGIGGWRMLETLGIEIDICHLNEAHAAYALLERARSFMRRHQVAFQEALWATRAGNVFTTHTAVAAAFDQYAPALMQQLLPYTRVYSTLLGIAPEELFVLGRRNPADDQEPFNTGYLVLRGCGTVNAVSRLHEEVSRRLFQPLYPRWPEREVPVTHVTNGVHMPSWDSPQADRVWERACGKDRWRGELEGMAEALCRIPDGELWSSRGEARGVLVAYARRRIVRQLGYQGAPPAEIEDAAHVLDPNALTLGFARRITEYKRPHLLLHDRARLVRLLTDASRPVQLIVAGKAHPRDEWGRRLVQEWGELARQPCLRRQLVFLEDYDLTMAQELVRGVDLWINTPRRPWEACGTSGMKVLVNGGLNLSELDGWWAEAYRPEVGWALGDGREHPEPDWDAREAEQLYHLLESEVVPSFYDRDGQGIPRAWVARVRASMASLAPRFSANRMVREYTERLYLPALARLRARTDSGGDAGKRLLAWHEALQRDWHTIRFGNLEVDVERERWSFRVQVYLGDVDPEAVRVELYAEPRGDESPVRLQMEPVGPIPGAVHAAVYHASVPGDRPAGDFTPRVVPYHPDALVPLEASPILWQR